ncbi:SH3 domain-containing protein [Limimaricola litoreus]|uniref:SH3 domain-containing protein n=1 Tax=Limimaricola litoreus TaxID=2955316 RepID=A0A9X2JRQ8_9RHOB|nr:SH3 domain-containing protein [Limimaricola litoreus]MCP1168961.1 SH3 domain-containing protein [Limimaricola litoreus]
MTRLSFVAPLRVAALCTMGVITPAAAQPLDVPFDTYCPPDAQAACFGVATVMGLDPNGDGFLAVRTGPGTQYPKIAEIHNGDRVGTYAARGQWQAISFGSQDRLGWVHANWLGNYIP